MATATPTVCEFCGDNCACCASANGKLCKFLPVEMKRVRRKYGNDLDWFFQKWSLDEPSEENVKIYFAEWKVSSESELKELLCGLCTGTRHERKRMHLFFGCSENCKGDLELTQIDLADHDRKWNRKQTCPKCLCKCVGDEEKNRLGKKPLTHKKKKNCDYCKSKCLYNDDEGSEICEYLPEDLKWVIDRENCNQMINGLWSSSYLDERSEMFVSQFMGEGWRNQLSLADFDLRLRGLCIGIRHERKRMHLFYGCSENCTGDLDGRQIVLADHDRKGNRRQTCPKCSCLCRCSQRPQPSTSQSPQPSTSRRQATSQPSTSRRETTSTSRPQTRQETRQERQETTSTKRPENRQIKLTRQKQKRRHDIQDSEEYSETAPPPPKQRYVVDDTQNTERKEAPPSQKNSQKNEDSDTASPPRTRKNRSKTAPPSQKDTSQKKKYPDPASSDWIYPDSSDSDIFASDSDTAPPRRKDISKTAPPSTAPPSQKNREIHPDPASSDSDTVPGKKSNTAPPSREICLIESEEEPEYRGEYALPPRNANADDNSDTDSYELESYLDKYMPHDDDVILTRVENFANAIACNDSDVLVIDSDSDAEDAVKLINKHGDDAKKLLTSNDANDKLVATVATDLVRAYKRMVERRRKQRAKLRRRGEEEEEEEG